jgi:hypothetical protein
MNISIIYNMKKLISIVFVIIKHTSFSIWKFLKIGLLLIKQLMCRLQCQKKKFRVVSL